MLPRCYCVMNRNLNLYVDILSVCCCSSFALNVSPVYLSLSLSSLIFLSAVHHLLPPSATSTVSSHRFSSHQLPHLSHPAPFPFISHVVNLHPTQFIFHSVSNEIKASRHRVFNPSLVLLISTFESPAVRLAEAHIHPDTQRHIQFTEKWSSTYNKSDRLYAKDTDVVLHLCQIDAIFGIL